MRTMTKGQPTTYDFAQTRRLAQAAQDAGLPFPDLHVAGCRADGFQVREAGKVLVGGFRDSVQAQRAATAIRNERWAATLGLAA